MIPKFKKKKIFPSVCRACWEEFHWYITHCNLINIHSSLFFWKKFRFSAKNSKFEKVVHQFVEHVESLETNPLMYNIKDLGYKWSPAFRLKVVVQTESILECTLEDLSYDIAMTRLPKLKISCRRGKQYTSPVTLGGRHNECF